MQYTIDKTQSANVALVLMYSPQTFNDCLIHAMDAYRAASDCLNNGDAEKFRKNVVYSKSKAQFAISLASGVQSKKRGAKAAIVEAQEIIILCDRLLEMQSAA